MNENPASPPLELVVALRRVDTKEIVSLPAAQTLREFKTRPSPLLLLPSTGLALLGLLQEHLDIIRIDEATGQLRVSHVLVGSPEETTARILGRVAEALVVHRCNSDPALNRRWAMHARQGQRLVGSVDDYVAVGTSLASTETVRNLSSYYNPGDPQRDVIWVGPGQNLLQMIGGTAMASRPAGLQLKTGRTLAPIITKGLRDGTYQVPIVFFDLGDDYPALVSRVGHDPRRLLRGRDIDPEAHELLLYYETILSEWIRDNGFIQGVMGDSLVASAVSLAIAA